MPAVANSFFKLSLSLLLVVAMPFGTSVASGPWKRLEDGLELGIFHSNTPSLFGSSEISILRVDPRLWDLKLYTIQELGYDTSITAKEWSARLNLTAVINAGMYLHDVTTHVGYLQAGDTIQSNHINRYQSVAGFSPKDKALPPFRIFDLDEDKTTIAKITAQYSYVVQNLRLIKRPGINRWTQQNQRWNEAALGEDKQGRALLIYSRGRLSVHDFNELLLSLPIDLVSAQHLEGGKEAQLYINHVQHTEEIANSLDNPFLAHSSGLKAWPIPNIIGVSKKSAADSSRKSSD
jgi:hypothetical protein